MDFLRDNLVPSNTTNSASRFGIYDLLLLLGALLALTLLLVIWAKYIRKEKRSRRRSHSAKQYELVPVVKEAESAEDDEDVEGEADARRRRKFRKRRREHRGSNPTLAETGGLPPLRDENSLNPPQ
ncbi:MAG: hypothetical protein HY043_21855 [Verrucomicrobia bacterium]|nr:hypothetical protein [Verrucomicrobiota bacterium]